MSISDLVSKQRLFFNSKKTLDLDFRKSQLKNLLKMIINNESLILEALKEDLGKPELEAFSSEVGFLKNDIKHMIKNFKTYAKPKTKLASIVNFPGKATIHQQPYGVVLNISPWNYPFQLALAPIVGAMAAGNTCILKPSEFAPATADLLKNLVSQSFDEDYFAVCLGDESVTKELVKQHLDYIFFTGGSEVGKHIMRAASENLTPVTLELGGKSPCVILEDAEIDTSAKRVAWGKFMNCGQTCVAPDFIYIHERIKSQFVEKLKHYIENFYGQDPIKSMDYGKIINDRHYERIASYLLPKHKVYGGDFSKDLLKISPTLVENVDWHDPLMKEEIFGPILPIITFENKDQAVDQLKSLPRPLAFYIFGKNRENINLFLEQLPFGGGCINETVMHLAELGLPFGGIGYSGMGAYHGKYSFSTFSHEKPVLEKVTWLDIPLRYPPFSMEKLKWIKKFMG